MSDPNNNKMSRIERAQKKLYAKKYTPEKNRRTPLEKKEYNVSTDWTITRGPEAMPIQEMNQGQETNQTPNSNQDFNVEDKPVVPVDFSNSIPSEAVTTSKIVSFWAVLIFAVVFFFGALGYAAFVFMGGGQTITAEDISINIVGPVSVGGGDKLSIDVVIQNNNSVTLEDADLVITYPDGTKATDLITDMKRGRMTVGDIKPGSVVKETLDMAFFGEEGDNKRVEVELEYKISGSMALFNKTKAFEISLNAAPIQIIVDGLDRVSSGQDVELELEVTSNSGKDIENLMIVANYPFGFKFDSSEIEPTIGNNIWIFDRFSPTQKETFKIKGKIDAQDNEIRFFRFEAGIVSDDNIEELGVIFTNSSHEISVEKPFIDLQLVINDQKDDSIVVSSGEQVFVVANFINSTNNTVSDVEIKFKLEGDILDKASVSAGNGFYSSSDNTILFDKNNSNQLTAVEPRAQEQFVFSFKSKKTQNQNGISSPQIKISSEVTGRRVSEDSSEERINETDLKIVQVLSDVLLQTFTLFDDGPFNNTGPIPPKADNDTTYTLLWSLSNNMSDLQDAKVTAILPPYISWIDVVSPSIEIVSYDPISRRMTWSIGNVSAGVGHTGNPREVNVQINLRPSVSQIGLSPNLLNNVVFSAYDTFAKTTFEKEITSPTTLLQEQAGALNKHQIVIQ